MAEAATQGGQPARVATPAQVAPRKAVPIHQAVVPIDQRVNVWKWQATDAAGNLVVPAEGATKFESRGPTSKAEMIREATLFLRNKRLDAIRAGQPDPGYEVIEDSVEPVPNTPPADADFGVWRPAGAKPVQLPHESEPGLAAGTVIPDLDQ